MNPAKINEWFPFEQQHKHVSLLKGRVNITRARAEYFLKLWAYLFIKQQEEKGNELKPPLKTLSLPEGFIPCTHKEAHELFYSNQDRGSERAAGMMLDKLAALGLIEKDFDGNTTCIRICSPFLNINDLDTTPESTQLIPDNFNPRTDTIPVTSFLVRYYDWMNRKVITAPNRLIHILREWADKYPKGMRVLRCSKTQNPVGFYALYPVAKESEQNFFLPPRKSLYLSTDSEVDPMTMALPGDKNCTCVHLRSWYIDSPYRKKDYFCKLLQDAKQTLREMQTDFPYLCDIYTLPLHPADEPLASAMGFQKISQDSQISICWMYLPLDKYLALDINQAASNLKFE
ncbi:MAG: hypothetical protein AAF378_17605 [Cyanobacteria bacterium P01_A01_bin.84]